MAIKQISSDTTIPIEEHFRVTAGPGAGKTFWLIKHIKNVLHNSKRLGKSRKVACITYTNVAVETILDRLGSASLNVEVSTIHSFLYKYIVKPYVSFIASDYELDVENLDGHDEHIANFGKVKNWINSDFQSLGYLYTNQKLTSYHLEGLRWSIKDDVLLLKITKRREQYTVIRKNKEVEMHFIGEDKQDKLIAYKKEYWKEGIIHHDDVLFFSYKLIEKYPFILQLIRAKFPYLFIDEFQDTNPIQTKILEMLGANESVIGIVGDKVQSIYKFQGAEPSQFTSFYLPNLKDYSISSNRRSTNNIIKVLNSVRKDVNQDCVRKVDGELPSIIVGEKDFALWKVMETLDNKNVYSLSRDNITSNIMKRNMDKNIPLEDLFDKLYGTDSNSVRRRVIMAMIKSAELALQGQYKEAIKEQVKIFHKELDKNIIRKAALKNIRILLSKYNSFKNGSLLAFSNFVKEEIYKEISKISTGEVKQFYESTLYTQLAVCVKITEDKSYHRTIHKAKGAEFENVLVILRKESDLEFLINSDLDNKEEHRINYVAISRAKDRLFINTPTLAAAKKKMLSSLFNIIEN